MSVCRQEDETTIKAAKLNTLLVRSPSQTWSLWYVPESFLPSFYRQSKDWIQRSARTKEDCRTGIIIVHWNICLHYSPAHVRDCFSSNKKRESSTDEVPCQVLHEQGRTAASDPICGSISAEQMESLPVIL